MDGNLLSCGHGQAAYVPGLGCAACRWDKRDKLAEELRALRADNYRMLLLLDEWLKTPFFATREEREAWVVPFRDRVVTEIDKARLTLQQKEAKCD
jgi:hypothetical protein